MFHDMVVLLYAITTGFTASGIIANLYRLAEEHRKRELSRTVYYASLVVAGPSMLFEKAVKSWRAKDCTWVALWLAAAVAGYWSLALGMFILEVALAVA
ncbi:MAG: DUF6949 family protein [Alphaproteobacteria bacterium]|jgi:hypothetical protein